MITVACIHQTLINIYVHRGLCAHRHESERAQKYSPVERPPKFLKTFPHI